MTGNDGREPTSDYTIYSSQHELLLEETAPSVPISIFSTQLSGLQALVRYLHATHSLADCAKLLHRSPKTMWATLEQTRGREFLYEESSIRIPLEIFASRNASVLESLVAYLASIGFTPKDIAQSLNKDPRVIATVRSRAKRKGVLQ